MRRCARCILSEGTLGITFDASGLCSFCAREPPPPLPLFGEGSLREQVIAREVREVIETQGGGGRYDCLALVSGGKDSVMALWLAAESYGLRTLAITIDNGFADESTIENARRAAGAFGADFRVIDGPAPREVFARFLGSEHRRTVSVCALCNQVRSSFFNAAFALAARERIPLLVDGRSKIGGHPGTRWPGLIRQSDEARDFLATLRDLGDLVAEHTAPSDAQWRGGWFSPWLHMRRDIDGTVRFLESRMGWIEPSKSWPRRSANCRLSLLDGYLCQKHEIPDNPCEHELSMEIRQGEITREAALRRFLHPPDPEALAATAAELGAELARL
ncbi:MAG: hypothetical protein IT372_22525 [Polyangiaceae bacterium]|nr:hypothetical protein [Polyangiaceae bacterium]